MFPRLSASLVALFSLVVIVAAIPSGIDELHGIEPRANGRKCGSNPTPEVVSEKENAFASILAENSGTDTPSAGPFTVPVNFNVIYASEDLSDGYIP